MTRYGKDQKQATRQRIIDAAGQRFKQDGIDGSGISTLMKDAGLTNGAFYAHFESKEDLVANVLAEQLREQGATLRAQTGGLGQYVRDYLSLEHRDNPQEGCPSAALLDEIGRCPDTIKRAYTEGLLEVIDDISAQLAPDSPESARVTALGAFASMIGTVQLSRALPDRQLADEVLQQGIRTTLATLGINHSE